jgi:hypothetical protein
MLLFITQTPILFPSMTPPSLTADQTVKHFPIQQLACLHDGAHHLFFRKPA